MPMIIKNNVRYCSTGGDAENIVYDNAESGMEATNMQDAIDELNSNLDIMKNWTFIGSVTGKQNSITLPSVFTELLVECAYDIGRYVNIVPKILISNDSRFFNLAGGFDLTNYGSDFGVFITNNKVTLRHGFVDSKDVSSSTITSVYCR